MKQTYSLKLYTVENGETVVLTVVSGKSYGTLDAMLQSIRTPEDSLDKEPALLDGKFEIEKD